jgi:DNA-3-methyladenine glycosylase II
MTASLHLTMQDESIRTLCQADPRMEMLIQLVGDVTIPLGTDPFHSLAMSIIGQQLSAKAANTIKGRVKLLAPEFTPVHVRAIDVELFRQAGVSYAKISYIHDLCDKIMAQDVRLDTLQELDQDDLIKHLTSIKGIGKWTAEMFLIFSLGKPDVLSLGDAGLQRAARWLHQLDERKDGNYLGQVARLWSPYRSYASLYLWESIDLGFVDSGLTLEQCVKSTSTINE